MKFIALFPFLLLAQALFAVVPMAPCPTVPEERLNFQVLRDLINNPACEIRTISDVLAHLPVSYRRKYALFFMSRSLQGPNQTDYLNPRAILFGSRENSGLGSISNLVMSFNGSPTQPAYKALEILEIDKNPNSPVPLKYYEIEFPWHEEDVGQRPWSEVQKRIRFSPPNSSKCMSCHGNPVRPIFPGYPDWTGSFGSFHIAPQPPEEVAGFAKYVANLATRGASRYSFLSQESSDYGDPFSANLFDQSNQDLHALLSNAYRPQLVQKILHTPNYTQYRYAIASAIMGCENFPSFLPQTLRRELLKNLDRRWDLKNKWTPEKLMRTWQGIYNHPRQFGLSEFVLKKIHIDRPDEKYPFDEFIGNFSNFLGGDPDFLRLQADTLETQGYSRVDPVGANLRLVLEGRGLDLSTWFLDLTEPTYRFNDGADFELRTLMDVAALDPQLKPIFPRTFDELARRSSEFRGPICARLKPLSLSALQGVHVAPLPRPKRGADLTADYPPVFAQVCARCHDSPSAFAPPIPFTQREKMNVWLSEDNYRAKLQSKVLSTEEGTRMPPTTVLTDDQLNSILRYLGNF